MLLQSDSLRVEVRQRKDESPAILDADGEIQNSMRFRESQHVVVNVAVESWESSEEIPNFRI